jgi:hypothetical protein
MAPETLRDISDCCLCAPDRVKNLVPFLRLARSEGGAETVSNDLDPLPELSDVLNSSDGQIAATLHHIIPIVHARLTARAAQEDLRADLRNYARTHALQEIARGMFHERRVRRILAEADAAGIPVILLKGAAFQHSLYAPSALRLGSDIDFLVKESDFSRMCDLMARHMTEVFDVKRRYSHETAFQWMFRSDDRNDPIIEIHRAITSPYVFSIRESDLWASSWPHPAYDSELIRILSPEDNILHLAVHAFRDLDYCTHNLLDAHEIWCQWKPDVSRLIQKSALWGATGVLYYLLLSIKRIMNTPIPQQVLDRLEPPKFRRMLNEWILTAPIIRSGKHYHPVYRLIQAVSQLSMPDSPFGGLRFHADYVRTRAFDLYRSLGSGSRV